MRVNEIEEMVKTNYELSSKLNKENGDYFANLVIYFRSSRIPERKAEALLLEILDHLIEAQKQGKTAEDVFGKNPESYSKEIIESMGGETFLINRYIYTFFLGVEFILLYYGITNGIKSYINKDFIPRITVNYLVYPVILPFLVDSIMMLLKRTAFVKSNKKFLIYGSLVYLLFTASLVGIMLVFQDYFIGIEFSPWAAMIIWLLMFAFRKFRFKNIDFF